MPLFERPADKSGVYVESTRAIFVRGRRLGVGTVRRLQDVVVALLAGMGMTSVEIAKLRPIVARQVRNINQRDGRCSEDEALRWIAMAVSLRHGPRWLWEVRDGVVALLLALGMDVEDAAAVMRIPRTAGAIRPMIHRLPSPIASRVSLAAFNAIQEVKPLLDAERARRDAEPPKRIPRRSATTQRRPRTIAMVEAPASVAAVA
jgi:hypothetical protein